MSIDLMRNIYKTGATHMDELTLLLDRTEGAVYNYLDRTELRAGQLIRLFRLAKSDKVRELILAELLPGSGFTALKLPGATDLDGDGDVDTDDALRSSAGVIRKASNALDLVLNLGDEHQYTDARRALKDAAERALAAVAIIDFVEAHAPRRRKARPVLQTGRTRQGVARG